MKEFLEPRLEVLQFCVEDIITLSYVEGGGIETPDQDLQPNT